MAGHTENAMQKHRDRPGTDAAAAGIGLDASLAFSSYALWLAMNKFYLQRLKALDLTFPQYLVMQALWEAGTLTVSGIGKRLSLKSGTLSPILQRMEELSLIQRVRSSGDERTVDVFLSDYGSALRSHAVTMEADINRDMGLPLQQRQLMQRQLADIKASIPPSPRPARH